MKIAGLVFVPLLPLFFACVSVNNICPHKPIDHVPPDQMIGPCKFGS